MQNPKDKDVKALYAAKPNIKSDDGLRAFNRKAEKANAARNRLEEKFENEAIAKFEKQGKEFKKDYFQEDLDAIVQKKMKGATDYRKGGMVLSTVDNRKKR